MPAAVAAALLAQLSPFEPLVGSCWSFHQHGGIKDRHCFEAVYGGKHVRDRHVVTSGPNAVYEGETLYSVEAGQVVFTYWNSLGGVGRGTMSAKDGLLSFRLRMRGSPDAEAKDVATVWRVAPDGYEVIDGDTHRFRRDGAP